jgi:hypothetical protein
MWPASAALSNITIESNGPLFWIGTAWLLSGLLPFIFVQRWLHREIQAVFLILTRRPVVALGLFSLLFFPGVFLHEFSHLLAAWLLRVRTGRVSLLPRLLPDGKLRMGYVETAVTDPLRDALIGMAPLVNGGIAIAFIGLSQLGLGSLTGLVQEGRWPAFWNALRVLPDGQDFWLWFYLAFAISSTMMPSASDRRGWLPVALGAALLVGLALLAGAGPWLETHAGPWLDQAFKSVALVFFISLALHIVLGIPIGLFRALLTYLTGLTVQ